jgi:hypothetical protein
MGEDNRALGNWSCSVQNRFEQPIVRERKSCEVKINEWMARRTREAAQMGLGSNTKNSKDRGDSRREKSVR